MFEENYRTNGFCFQSIKKTKRLSREEELEIIKRARNGDVRARNLLVSSHMRFVLKVCFHYKNQGMPMADLIGEGALGLIRATKHFDENKGLKFISYAVWWVRQGILQALDERAHILRLPASRIVQLRRKMNLYERMMQKLSRAPTHEELAGVIGAREKDIVKISRVAKAPKSLDAEFGGEGSGTLRELLPDENAEDPNKKIEGEELAREIAAALKTLAGKERRVIKGYYGLGGGVAKTLDQIGQEMNLTRERVRQIKNKAITRLQHPSRIGRLRGVMG